MNNLQVASSYAKQINQRYEKNHSHYVDIVDRYNQTLESLNPMKLTGYHAQLNDAIQKFITRYPYAQQLSDLELVQSLELPLSNILIDTTLQRLLDLPWIISIINNFRPVQAQPIQVYPVNGSEVNYTAAGDKGLYASWDGQHTVVALYIIACLIFKQDPKDVKIPVNVYNVSKKAEIRENFVAGNSSRGKKFLDNIDLYQQMIYGARVDGNKNAEWEEINTKQQYLQDADLFVTADKFGDSHMPGAISRLQEIFHYSSDIIRQFALYTTTFPVARPIASQEIEIMCAWFHMTKVDGIRLDDSDIISLGNHLHQLFGADFHESSNFWTKVHTAYKNWHRKYWDGAPQAPSRINFSKNWRNGGTFLWYQLHLTWDRKDKIPALNINSVFQPSTRDLYHGR